MSYTNPMENNMIVETDEDIVLNEMGGESCVDGILNSDDDGDSEIEDNSDIENMEYEEDIDNYEEDEDDNDNEIDNENAPISSKKMINLKYNHVIKNSVIMLEEETYI